MSIYQGTQKVDPTATNILCKEVWCGPYLTYPEFGVHTSYYSPSYPTPPMYQKTWEVANSPGQTSNTYSPCNTGIPWHTTGTAPAALTYMDTVAGPGVSGQGYGGGPTIRGLVGGGTYRIAWGMRYATPSYGNSTQAVWACNYGHDACPATWVGRALSQTALLGTGSGGGWMQTSYVITLPSYYSTYYARPVCLTEYVVAQQITHIGDITINVTRLS